MSSLQINNGTGCSFNTNMLNKAKNMIALRSGGNDDDSDGWSSDDNSSNIGYCHNNSHEKVKSEERNEVNIESDYVQKQTLFNSSAKPEIFLKSTEGKDKVIKTNKEQNVNNSGDENNPWAGDDDLVEQISESEIRRQLRDKMSKTAVMLSCLFSKRRDLESVKFSSENCCVRDNKINGTSGGTERDKRNNDYDNDSNLEYRSNIAVLTDSVTISNIDISVLECHRNDNDDESSNSCNNGDINNSGYNNNINLVVTVDNATTDSVTVLPDTDTMKSHSILEVKNSQINSVLNKTASNISPTSDSLPPHLFHIPQPRTVISCTESSIKSSSFPSAPLCIPFEYIETKDRCLSSSIPFNQSNVLAVTLTSASYSSLSSDDVSTPPLIPDIDLQDLLLERSLVCDTSSKSLYNISSNNFRSKASSSSNPIDFSSSWIPPAPPPPPLVASLIITSTNSPLSTIELVSSDTRSKVVNILAAIKLLEEKLARNGVNDQELLALISPLQLAQIFPTIDHQHSIPNDNRNGIYVSDRKGSHVTADEVTSFRILQDHCDRSPQPPSISYITEAPVMIKDSLKKSSKVMIKKIQSGSELHMQRQSFHSTVLFAPLLSSRPSYRSLTSIVSASIEPARLSKSGISTYIRDKHSPPLHNAQNSPSTCRLECPNGKKETCMVNNEDNSKACKRNQNICSQQPRWQ